MRPRDRHLLRGLHIKIEDWRTYCLEQLKAANVRIKISPSGAMRIQAGGVNALTSGIGSLSKQELEKMTRVKAHMPFNDLTRGAVAN